MVSLNDGEDPHFRKAAFDPARCPTDCSRPCERVCPAQAIVFSQHEGQSGVIDSRCYGCGRCLPVCPIEQIYARSYVSTPAAIAPQIFPAVDAVEIHTQVGREQEFQRLWQAIKPETKHLKLIAISCPDGEGVIEYLWRLWAIVSPLSLPLIWQTDGRPMSGDIGEGATAAAVRFGEKVLQAGLPGYVQLAGGTNSSTVQKLRALRLLNNAVHPSAQAELTHRPAAVAGIAYGSYARKLLSPILEMLDAQESKLATRQPETAALGRLPGLALSQASSDKPNLLSSFSPPEAIDSKAIDLEVMDSNAVYLEDAPELLLAAVRAAADLVYPLKGSSPFPEDFSPSSGGALLALPS
nr:LdpA C-terminal domain-containing domain [Pseudanabaena sp. FACHB-2040]